MVEPYCRLYVKEVLYCHPYLYEKEESGLTSS
jgi:hypothetical protein